MYCLGNGDVTHCLGNGDVMYSLGTWTSPR